MKRTRKKLLLILTSFLLVVFLNSLVGNNIVKAPIEIYSITINNGTATTNSLDVTLTYSDWGIGRMDKVLCPEIPQGR